MITIRTKIGNKNRRISGYTVKDLCNKASELAGFKVTPKRVLKLGIYSTVYLRNRYHRLKDS